MEITTVVSIAISIAAFVLSATALWQTHFAKFRVVCSVGNLQLQIYPFESHCLPSVDIPITITNTGARVGRITGMRVRVSYPGLSSSSNYEFFNPKWDVDYKKFYPISGKRFEWFDKAIIGEWMPFVALPKQTISKHLIFESRWDEPIFYDEVIFELEIRTGTSRKWAKVARWDAFLSPEMIDENVNDVSSFIFIEANSDEPGLEENTDLIGLHDQINKDYTMQNRVLNAKTSVSSGTRKKSKRKKSG
ncbi:MAG: hypothetical protein Q7T89_07720 [Anaerolineales bacterium]|nr:hypothetical protein [Anaerolineales bacterium]